MKIKPFPVENFEISLWSGEPMLTFDLPEALRERFPRGLGGEPECSIQGDGAILAYREAWLEFPGAPGQLLSAGSRLLCAQMGRGDLIAAEYARRIS